MQSLSSGGLKAGAQRGILSTHVCGGVHRRVRRGLVRVPAVEMGIVGVVMGVVSLRVVVPALPGPLVVVVVAVVLVRVRRGLQVLVRVRVHVMVASLLLSRRHHLHHVAHGVHVAVGDGAGVVRERGLQPLGGQNQTQRL